MYDGHTTLKELPPALYSVNGSYILLHSNLVYGHNGFLSYDCTSGNELLADGSDDVGEHHSIQLVGYH